MSSSDWRNLWHVMSCFHLFQAGTGCDWLRAVHSLYTLQTPLLKTCYLYPTHSSLHPSVKQIIQEHFEYLSIVSSFNIITSLTYMRYKIFLSCETIIDISTMCTYMQQNCTPCPSKQVIRVYTL